MGDDLPAADVRHILPSWTIPASRSCVGRRKSGPSANFRGRSDPGQDGVHCQPGPLHQHRRTFGERETRLRVYGPVRDKSQPQGAPREYRARDMGADWWKVREGAVRWGGRLSCPSGASSHCCSFRRKFAPSARALLNGNHKPSNGYTTNKIRLDAFVMGAGTGGCLAGVSLFLRGKECPAKVYLVDPPGSALFNRVRYGVCYTPQMSERGVKKHRCGYAWNCSGNVSRSSDLLSF